MGYKLLYIEDNPSDSREVDLRSAGFDVEVLDPSSDMSEIMNKMDAIDVLILDFRLTAGANHACFDAPTIAQTIRTKHNENKYNFPIVLMSNETAITDYYQNFTSHDLFDYVLSKGQFTNDIEQFEKIVHSFIKTYQKIKDLNFNINSILGLEEDEYIDSRIIRSFNEEAILKDIFGHSRFVNEQILNYTGILIDEDVLSARLGVSKESKEWGELKKKINSCKYTGVFSDIYERWWMDKLDKWWKEETVDQSIDEYQKTPIISLRQLDAKERVDKIKEKYELDLDVIEISKFSVSSNFWTVCYHSKKAIDPFDGIELQQNYFPWQDKRYLSLESAGIKMEKYKNQISDIDKKEIREILQNNGI